MTKKNSKQALAGPILANASYTSEQLCAALGIERTTLWRYQKEGLKFVKNGSRRFYYGRDVQVFLFGESTVSRGSGPVD